MQRSSMLRAALALLATIGWMVWGSPSFGGALQETLSRANIEAPPERLFALIEDYHDWAKWSPHERDDPAVRRTYSGPVKGKGAMYEWDGDTHFGAGRAQIAEADAPTKLAVDLDLTRPLQGHLRLTFTLERKGATTDVAVSTNGPEDVVRHAMDTFFGGNLVPLACAADGLSKKFCDLMMNLHRP